ncbi:MAG: hypothetical protein CMN71_12475 [Sphingomonadaceae bacterium]|nr:hypothetical protein [Sphingomonadaceae bacterium]
MIDREPERSSLTASEIADRLDVSKPMVTRTLRSLEEAALVEVSSSSSDGRSREVSATRAGQEKFEACLPGYFAILDRATSPEGV